MRVVVLGGTAFIGRAIVEALRARGDQIMVVHRGRTEPPGWDDVVHLHAERSELRQHRDEIRAFDPQAAVDTYALTAADADDALATLPEVPTVVLSSQDVYQAFAALNSGGFASPIPLTEDAELRRERYPYRDAGRGPRFAQYDKLDVEERFLPRGAVSLRLPAVYGPHDGQLREWPVMRRVRAGRSRIPVGVGNLLWTRVHVIDAANAVLAALDTSAAAGMAINIGESQVYPVTVWWRQIVDAMGADVEFVRVPEPSLPEDLGLSGAFTQHVVADVSLARELLGWRAGDPVERVRESVTWHQAHLRDLDWSETDAAHDDAALAADWSETDAAHDDAALAAD